MPPAGEVLAFFAALARYWLAIIPSARRELRGWERRARTIPDPILRAHALSKLRNERLNAEAAAVFSTLVPIARAASLVRLTVAFQVMYDYLDAVSEQSDALDSLRDGCSLHRALTAALDPSAAGVDYYRHHPRRNDGGYLDALVATCRVTLDRLPSTAAIASHALRAAARCGEGQSRTHASSRVGVTQLADWSLTQATDQGFNWWELAAGAGAPLSLYALFAAATDPRTTPADAASIEAAYYPWVCALSNLLDGLIDYSHDAASGDHNYIAYYAANTAAADRLGVIASDAAAAARKLRHGSRHIIVVAGVAGFYLSEPEANSDFARPVTQSVIASLGPIFPPIFAVMRLRRYAHHKKRAGG